ncbi:hypothetical protein SAMN05444008_105187 [Cnuella takakiae]|uniref:Contractile injection system tube protein N-terminal domain-containing protein n=1 Tax=Cnuella takakiae TaxID=1302690 RepID=A0A1M4ZDX0_9BACT|nr:hypothetical protein [Cnuella takakiae]OLY94241.1 hypothetical protein BUE76_21900 [Cnuella takakiae]SHF16168.1 hypothetical protein SAMN05444008_105187 [Cnuella takakiae]
MTLLKMTILSFKSFEKPADLLNPRVFMAMFNPASYKVEFNLTKDKKEATGDAAQSTPVTAVSLKKMSFDFLVDGTGANGDQRVVLQETKKFESVVMPGKKDLLSFNSATGNAHLKLPQLLLLWGTFVFPCEIEAFSVNYTLFNQLGIPLRATINASFNEVEPKPRVPLLDRLANAEVVETIGNAASFLSTAFSATNNVVRAVEMAREENLNSIRSTFNR